MEKIKNNIIVDKLPYVILGIILLCIGYDIGKNMEFFYIDNPSVLMDAQYGVEALIYQMSNNLRMDFMFNIITMFSAALMGNTPTAHYMMQFIAYLLTIIIAFFFLKKYCARKWEVAACVSLLLWCSSIEENLYTIGKKEVYITASIAVFIMCLYKLVFEQNDTRKKVMLYCLYIGSLLFGMTLKETSNIVIVLMVMLVIYICLFKREYLRKVLGCCLGIVVIFGIVQLYKYLLVADSSYTDYELVIDTIIYNIKFYFKYHFDVCCVAIIGLVSNLILFLRDVKNEKNAYLLIINITGWGYVAGICLWRWSWSYYLYPAILFFALSMINFFVLTSKKMFRIVIGVLIFFLACYGIHYNYCVAKSHKDASIIYTNSLYSLESIVEDGSRIIIDDSALYEEPPVRMKNLLVDYMGNNVSVYGGRQNFAESEVTEERLLLYGYTEERYEEEKKEAIIREGDYLIHYINKRNYYGHIRAINPIMTEDTISQLQQQGYIMELLDEQLLESKYLDFSDGQFALGNMQTGYQIYKVTEITYTVNGVMADGWCSRNILIKNYTKGTNCNIIVNDIGTAINHFEKNYVDIYVDGEYVERLEVIQGSIIELEQYIYEEVQENHVIELVVETTFVPSEYDSTFDEHRELGINVQLVDY